MASRPTRRRMRVTDVDFRKCASQKIGYATKDAALDAAEATMRRGNVQPGCHLTPYLCDACGEWHIYNRQVVAVPGQRRRGGGQG